MAPRARTWAGEGRGQPLARFNGGRLPKLSSCGFRHVVLALGPVRKVLVGLDVPKPERCVAKIKNCAPNLER